MLNHTNDSAIKKAVQVIVRKHGGYREAGILAQPHNIEADHDTWNADHKVVNVTAATPETDGYCPGFAVDLVTGTICG